MNQLSPTVRPRIWLVCAFIVALLATCEAFAEETMKYPLAVAVGKDSAVYVADRDLPGIWKFADNKWSIYFQGSKKFRTPLNAVESCWRAIQPRAKSIGLTTPVSHNR
jgi:hypothetical protein